jgi:hypothetical protein
LQILRASLIITGLLGDATRFRCNSSGTNFIFSVDRSLIAHQLKELHGKAFQNSAR